MKLAHADMTMNTSTNIVMPAIAAMITGISTSTERVAAADTITGTITNMTEDVSVVRQKGT